MNIITLMNSSMYTTLFNRMSIFVCLFLYSFFIVSFIYIHLFQLHFTYKNNLNFNLIYDYYKSYIAFSTAIDCIFLLGIFVCFYVISNVFDIQNICIQILLLICIILMAVYMAFYIVLPILTFTQLTTQIVSQFKKTNAFTHYLIFGLLIFIMLKFIQYNYSL